MRRYRQPVFRLVLSILGQAFSGDAEEVAQEVFIRAHRGLISFRGDAQFSSWIYRIAFNQAVLECIYELPEIYQSAVRLHYWIGASIEEIATLLGVPENTAKSYLHRSRKLLYTRLTEKGIEYV